MIDFNFEQFREAEPFVPAGADKPKWHGMRAKAAMPPRWWSIPRDHANDIQVSHAPEPRLIVPLAVVGLLFILAATVGMLMAIR